MFSLFNKDKNRPKCIYFCDLYFSRAAFNTSHYFLLPSILQATETVKNPGLQQWNGRGRKILHILGKKKHWAGWNCWPWYTTVWMWWSGHSALNYTKLALGRTWAQNVVCWGKKIEVWCRGRWLKFHCLAYVQYLKVLVICKPTLM